jgi:hypothetical protein
MRSASDSGNTVSGPLFRRLFNINWGVEAEAPIYSASDNVLGGVVAAAYDGMCPMQEPLVTSGEVGGDAMERPGHGRCLLCAGLLAEALE